MSATKTTTDTQPELTLAILVHNPNPDYLNALFESLQQQTGDFYVDVVDDSPEACQFLELPDDLNTRYLRNGYNPHGLSGNWNFAVQHARTPWVTVLHQDDVLHADYTQIITRLVKNYPHATAAFCHATIIDADGCASSTFADRVKDRLLRDIEGDDYCLSGEIGSSRLLQGNFVFCPTLCFNRERLGLHGFNERWRMVPDLELYLRLLIDGNQLAGSKQVGLYYRRHDEQATAKYQATGERFDEEFALYREFALAYRAKGWNAAERTARRATILKLHVLKEAVSRVLRGRFKRAWGLVRYLK